MRAIMWATGGVIILTSLSCGQSTISRYISHEPLICLATFQLSSHATVNQIGTGIGSNHQFCGWVDADEGRFLAMDFQSFFLGDGVCRAGELQDWVIFETGVSVAPSELAARCHEPEWSRGDYQIFLSRPLGHQERQLCFDFEGRPSRVDLIAFPRSLYLRYGVPVNAYAVGEKRVAIRISERGRVPYPIEVETYIVNIAAESGIFLTETGCVNSG